MKLVKSLLLTGLFASSVSTFAAVPYSFTNGTPADASQINADFSALVTQIAALQAQITALQAGPTMASLAGAYSIVEMRTELDSSNAPTGYALQSEVDKGVLTLNADGSASITSTNYSSSLNFSQNPVTVMTAFNAIPGSYIDGVYPAMGTVQSQQVVTSVGTHSATAVNSIIPITQDVPNVAVSSGSNSSSDGGPLTWSLAGNVITIHADSDITLSVAGKILVGADVGHQNGNPDGLIILVHQ